MESQPPTVPMVGVSAGIHVNFSGIDYRKIVHHLV